MICVHNLNLTTGFHIQTIRTVRSTLPNLSTATVTAKAKATESRSWTPLQAASDYENDPFVNDRPYFSDTFRVAGQPVDGHQVLTPRDRPRPPTPRGPPSSFPEGPSGYMNDRQRQPQRQRYYPSTPEETTFRVGGRPVEGHQVLRPPPTRARTERGEHMRVTTSNPRFLRTDRPRRDEPYDDYDNNYDYDYPYDDDDLPSSGPRRPQRYGAPPFRVDSEDLRDLDDDMPMRDDEWGRSGRARPIRNLDDFDEMPHFLTDDVDVGLPVHRDELFERDGPRRERVRSRRSSSRDFELTPNDFNDVPVDDRDLLRQRQWRGERPEESIREKEWRELDERRARRRPRLDRQDIQGLGRMPMQGDDWDDYRYPERRRPYDREGRRYRDIGNRQYAEEDERDIRRPYSSREESLDQVYRRGDARRVDDFDDDYVRDGPHMVPNRWRSSSRRDEDEAYQTRTRYGNPEYQDFDTNYGKDRYRHYDDVTPRRYFSREDEERGTLYSGPKRRDERGSVGGPMPEDLMGVDRRYSSTKQKWAAGTSFDTVS